MSAVDAYEAVPYDDRPVTETHPDRLHFETVRAGLPPPPAALRVLELGCAHAINLIPMAFHRPGASFVGVDLSPGQIERARERVSALGLDNLELRCADVMELELGGPGFDLIIAHGLFSWVPEPVRERVLALCRAHLAPHGVAYISYNAMPAWGVRGAIRRAIRCGLSPGDEPARQLRDARALLERLAGLQPLRGTAEGALLAAEIEGLRDKPDAYLLHEYLVPEARAFYLEEFVARAERAGLRWFGDVAPSGLDPARERPVRAALGEMFESPLVAEQLADIVGFRQFRASLLCREDAPRGPAPTPAALVRRSWLAAVPQELDGGLEPGVAAVLERLHDAWPASVAFEAVPASDRVDPEALARALWEQHLCGRLRLEPRSLPIAALGSSPPRVCDLTRVEAADQVFVTNPRHECAPLDAFHAALIGRVDGSRGPDALVEALIVDIGEGRLELAGGVTPSAAQLRAALPGMVSAGLRNLEAAGLLSP